MKIIFQIKLFIIIAFIGFINAYGNGKKDIIEPGAIEWLSGKIKCNPSSISYSLTEWGVDNKVYLIKDSLKKNSKPIAVLKIYSKPAETLDKIELSLKNVNKLLDQNFLVSKILASDRRKDEKLYVAMEFIDGNHPTKLEATNLSMIARETAILHTKSAISTYEKPLPITKVRNLLDSCSTIKEFSRIKKIFNEIKFSKKLTFPNGFIHGDISQSNILINNGKFYFLDFDHSANGYFISDIARAQIFFAFDDTCRLIPQNLDIFLQGYQDIRKLTNDEKRYFFDLIKLFLIEMTLETYYYVKVLATVDENIFQGKRKTQAYECLLQKLIFLDNYLSNKL